MKTKEIKEWLVDSNVSKAWGSDTKSPPIDLGTAIELGCHVKIVHKLYYLDLPGLLRYLQVVILHGGKLRSTSKNQNNMVFNDVMKTSTLMLQQPIFVHAGQSHLGPLGHVIALMRTSNHLWCHVIWRANHGGRFPWQENWVRMDQTFVKIWIENGCTWVTMLTSCHLRHRPWTSRAIPKSHSFA